MNEPAPRKRKRDGAATREKILAEALALFARKGFDATSIKDISSAVGVADAALYRHFPSKDDIAHTVFTRHYGALAQDVSDVAARHVHIAPIIDELIAMLCRLFDQKPDVFAFILINQHNHLRFVGYKANPVEECVALMRTAQDRGQIAISDPQLAAAIALGAAIQPAIFHLYGRLEGSLSDKKEVISEAVRKALGVKSLQQLKKAE